MLATVLDYADLEEVLSFMEGKARELGLEGVAVVDVYPRVADGEPIRHSVLYVREIGNFVITDQEGKYNCYGVALMKVAVCRRSRQPSGFPSDDQQILEGESAYRGAVYLEHLLTDAVIAFSGGTQEQDLMVVLEGAARLKRVLDWEIKYQARECQSDWTPVNA